MPCKTLKESLVQTYYVFIVKFEEAHESKTIYMKFEFLTKGCAATFPKSILRNHQHQRKLKIILMLMDHPDGMKNFVNSSQASLLPGKPRVKLPHFESWFTLRCMRIVSHDQKEISTHA